MRAAISRDIKTSLVMEDVDLADPRAGEVLVRMDASAICTTDANGLRGMSPAPRPFITGHSATGIVEEVGADVTRTRVGDRIVVAGSMECGECFTCLRGAPSQCERMWEGIFTPHHVGTSRVDGARIAADGGAGALGEYMLYRERCYAVVESDLPVEQLALLGCGVLSGVGAVLEVARVRPGDSVVIVGCGHLGLWMVQGARLAGAATIIAVEPIAARRDLARQLGATHVVDPSEHNVAAAVQDLTGGRGADVALEASATTEAMTQIFDLARHGGIVVPTSMSETAPTDQATFPALPLALFGKQIRGSQSGGGHIRRDIPRFAALIESGALQAAPFVSRTYRLDESQAAMDDALARVNITGIVLNQS
ncbi:zinc-dependent alcohol dehydrogenase family protein [Okibacterium endophyticum]